MERRVGEKNQKRTGHLEGKNFSYGNNNNVMS